MYKLFCRSYQLAFRCAAVFLPWRRPRRLRGLAALARLLRERRVKKALLVTDARLSALGMPDGIIKTLDAAGTHIALYDGTVPNPTVNNIEEALALYQKEKCAAIIALGGGSSIDCAKGVGARVAQPRKSLWKMRGQLKVSKPMPLFIAIPTTAGSGSETTLAAVVVDKATREKYAINDPALIPHYVAFEPSLAVRLPAPVTAYTGMDALCHAVEAYIGRGNTPQTRRGALRAAALIFKNLYAAYINGQDLKARGKMQEAAYLAGAAFTRAFVGNIHAVSHTLSGLYGTPHGLANAVIMPYVLEMYGKAVRKPLTEMARAVGLNRAAAFIAAIRSMNKKMSLPDKIAELKEADIPLLIRRALREANPLYPVPVIFGYREMERVYRKILR